MTSLLKRKATEDSTAQKKTKVVALDPISMPSRPPMGSEILKGIGCTEFGNGVTLFVRQHCLSSATRDEFWRSSKAYSVRTQRELPFGKKTSYRQTFFADHAVRVRRGFRGSVFVPQHIRALEEALKHASPSQVECVREYVVENYFTPEIAHSGRVRETGKKEDRDDVCALMFYSLGQTRYLQVKPYDAQQWTSVEMSDNSLAILTHPSLFRNCEYRWKELSAKEEAGTHMHVMFQYMRSE